MYTCTTTIGLVFWRRRLLTTTSTLLRLGIEIKDLMANVFKDFNRHILYEHVPPP